MHTRVLYIHGFLAPPARGLEGETRNPSPTVPRARARLILARRRATRSIMHEGPSKLGHRGTRGDIAKPLYSCYAGAAAADAAAAAATAQPLFLISRAPGIMPFPPICGVVHFLRISGGCDV